MSDVALVYLLTFPDLVDPTGAPPGKITGFKDAPYFQPVDISVCTLPGSVAQIGTAAVTVLCQRYDERIQMVECRYEIPEPLSMSGLQERERIQIGLRELLVPQDYRSTGLYEEYVILCLARIDGSPDAFIEANAPRLARFIRSQTVRHHPQ